MTFTGIAHVALRCTDIDRSIAFYRDIFGFREMFRLNQDDGRLWLVYMHVTDTTYLELFPDGDGREVPGKDATGFNHLCIETGDIDAAVALLVEHGIPLVKPLTTGRDNNRQCWIDDPDGNRIEIMEMAAHSLQSQALARMS